MKLKERPDFVGQVGDEGIAFAKVLAPPPIFDINRAIQARECVENYLENHANFPALRVALTLSLYNLSLKQDLSSQEQIGILKRFEPLKKEEIQASSPKDPRPTIGWEVEILPLALDNLKKCNVQPEALLYEDFFRSIGFYNFNNSFHNNPSYVEFSPFPSYSAGVSGRILSELIKGGFIPSLRNSDRPEDIKDLLSPKLMSLHVNLGIPRNVPPPISDDDLRILSLAMTLAFTSPLRIQLKSSSMLCCVKLGTADMVETNKSGAQSGRVELKSLEVRNKSVYRLLHEAQLLGTSLFSTYTDNQMGFDPLSYLWRDTRGKISSLFNVINLGNQLLADKLKLAEFAKETQVSLSFLKDAGMYESQSSEDKTIPISSALRWFITNQSQIIAQYIPKSNL